MSKLEDGVDVHKLTQVNKICAKTCTPNCYALIKTILRKKNYLQGIISTLGFPELPMGLCEPPIVTKLFARKKTIWKEKNYLHGLNLRLCSVAYDGALWASYRSNFLWQGWAGSFSVPPRRYKHAPKAQKGKYPRISAHGQLSIATLPGNLPSTEVGGVLPCPLTLLLQFHPGPFTWNCHLWAHSSFSVSFQSCV